MGRLENMIAAMSSIGIYIIDNSTLIYRELASYAAGMNGLSEEADEAIRECFVETAQDIGLRSYEEILGPPRDDLSIADRRRLLLKLFAIGSSDFTLEGVERYFESIGFSGTIIEQPQYFNLYIIPDSLAYSTAQRALIRERAAAFLPCHLTFTIDFRIAVWDSYDSLERTFDEWDGADMTWEQLDAFEVL